MILYFVATHLAICLPLNQLFYDMHRRTNGFLFSDLLFAIPTPPFLSLLWNLPLILTMNFSFPFAKSIALLLLNWNLYHNHPFKETLLALSNILSLWLGISRLTGITNITSNKLHLPCVILHAKAGQLYLRVLTTCIKSTMNVY